MPDLLLLPVGYHGIETTWNNIQQFRADELKKNSKLLNLESVGLLRVKFLRSFT